MNHKLFLATAVLLLCTLGGCGQPAGTDYSAGPAVVDANAGQSEESNKDPPASTNQLLAESTLDGTVLEFSEASCVLTPTIHEDGWAYSAAPGYENPETNIMVMYLDNCSFQIATANLETGQITYEEATIQDIKKQTSLVLYGQYTEEKTFQAEKVYIYRTMED